MDAAETGDSQSEVYRWAQSFVVLPDLRESGPHYETGRSYCLTAKGERKLAADHGSWREFATAVTAFLERRPWPATP